MKKTAGFIFLLLILSTSCIDFKKMLEYETTEEEPNIIKTFYKNGKIKTEVRIDKEKKRHGISRSYYDNGFVKTEITYDHGVKTNAIQFYDNGNKFMEFPYKNGKKHGIRKKYWESGKIQSALEYHEDNPKTGLIEYKRDGEVVTKYPTLKVRQIDRMETSGKYIVEVYFSSNPNRAAYYLGKLEKGVLNKRLPQLQKVNGRGRYVYNIMAGSFLMEELTFVASYKTTYGNPYIVTAKTNVAIDF
ncbi:MAG: hypothetical protein ABFS32_07790 [Bacteroidota bacterium]